MITIISIPNLLVQLWITFFLLTINLIFDSNFFSGADLFSKKSSHDISVDTEFVDIDSSHYIFVEASAASDQHIYVEARFSLSIETEFVSVNSSHYNSVDVELVGADLALDYHFSDDVEPVDTNLELELNIRYTFTN
ncbi:hypothetical protein C2G38_2221428 [Gigaspora rosea]|uniref:Uncharacterized protein n=1 Tax=Gigaspora rosea TaxID=44941 RepID=A0A397U6S0_9GLOM|nr:hypothetical protein C2G38_2221428 [Gigaspora rosea]